ncbi:MAG TPA: dihydrofolate reductase family protein [Gemmatimonadaceae bacterium]|nr:dihydrofolate reductase family protein [Gemmatimonadaceae bacterium]
MRRLAINTFLTLDGVMQAPGGPEEDPSGGFKHGGWSVNYWDDQMGKRMDEFSVRKPFDLLLGRKTYEIFAAHWPYVGSDDAMGAALNKATKYVASRTLQRVDWQNSQLLRGDVAQRVAELKREDGPEIQVHGSANLIQTLLEHDLIDVFSLWLFPLVLGTGKRLFAEGTVPKGFKLVDSETSSTGVIMTRFERAGAINYGSFALEQPTQAEVERREKVNATS